MDSLSTFLRKWITLEISILGFCILLKNTDAHILVYSNNTNQPIEEYNDLPAQFGPSLPSNGLKVIPILAQKDVYACKYIESPPRGHYPSSAKFVAIIQRGGVNCSFEKKVRVAQAAMFNAVIVYNNEGDELGKCSEVWTLFFKFNPPSLTLGWNPPSHSFYARFLMQYIGLRDISVSGTIKIRSVWVLYTQNSTGINIPSVFVGHTTGISLISIPPYQVILVINDELPFNINTQLILPFAILIGLCFLIMIFYMIYKCIREERRLRRYRLPKSMLKKLPITKFSKTNELSYDTCVICLEEFVEGDKMRVLPCKHPYHSHCIDPWLTENRRVCPICKRKVFTKGEVRTNRNRQSSLDSVTDTDDDTTPLLRPANSQVEATTTTPAAAETTHHGTFERRAGIAVAANLVSTSDDENVLSDQNNTQRVNPFNLPQNVNIEAREPRSGFFSFARLFRRRSPISIAAPLYIEEVFPENVVSVPSMRSDVAAITSVVSIPSSNNILNPNLSGSFKDDGDDDDDNESPPHSIYEPIAVVTTPTAARDVVNVNDDSVFIQTPTQGGIGVAALPNSTNRPTNQRQFHI